MVVEDAAPMVGTAFAFLAVAALHRAFAGHLIAVIEIVDGVKDGVPVFEFDRLAVGKNLAACCP